jgi:hypothetical protein
VRPRFASRSRAEIRFRLRRALLNLAASYLSDAQALSVPQRRAAA